MASPNRRTWLLADLARDVDYRLWFCERERRWEVEVLGAWLPVDVGPWLDEDQADAEPDQPAEWTPDPPRASEARTAHPASTPDWTAPLARPAWLRPL